MGAKLSERLCASARRSSVDLAAASASVMCESTLSASQASRWHMATLSARKASSSEAISVGFLRDFITTTGLRVRPAHKAHSKTTAGFSGASTCFTAKLTSFSS